MVWVFAFDAVLSDDEQARLNALARSHAATAAIRVNPRFGCTYATVEATEEGAFEAITSAYPGARGFSSEIIALAIEPEAREALPLLESALRGPGAPVGVAAVRRFDEAIRIEFNARRTSLDVLSALIDVELRRFGSPVRRTTVLSDLPLDVQAFVAASGLQAPEIDRTRILESLVERADL